MPFGSYQESPQQAFRSAAELMAAGAQMVKLEGGAEFAETVRFLTQRGVPVCGHLGLTPQSVHKFGGYRVQGKGEDAEQAADRRRDRARVGGRRSCWCSRRSRRRWASRSRSACAFPPSASAPGPGCSGQVLVLHDMLDVFPGKKAQFVRNFMKGASSDRRRCRALRARGARRQLSRRRAQLLVDIITSVAGSARAAAARARQRLRADHGQPARRAHPADAPREAACARRAPW